MPRDRGFLGSLALWTLLCALWGASKLVDLESVPLYLALQHQDLRLHQPQPPGFILHVWLAQLLHACGATPFLALRLVSWLILAAAAAILFRSVQLLHDVKTARWAVVLFLSSPLVLFHGMITGTAGDEALVATVALFLCMRAVTRGSRSLRLEAYVLGLCAGLRPTTLVFSLPMLLWTGKKCSLQGRSAAGAGLAWFLGMLCWLVPQADLAGGLDDYFRANAMLLSALVHTAPLLREPLAWLGDAGTPITALLFGLGACRLLCSLAVVSHGGTRLERGFVLAWVLPVSFYGLALGFRHTGSILALWPLLCIALTTGWSAFPVAHSRRLALLLGAAALDVVAFFALPASTWDDLEGADTAPPMAATAPLDGDASKSAAASSTDSLGEAPSWGAGEGAALLLQRVDFFHAATQHAPFEAFLRRLAATPFPMDSTLLLGGAISRAACVDAPSRSILQADPLRPHPFLLYHELRPTVLDSTYVVPSYVAWLLLEGEASQLVIAPPQTETQRPLRPLRLGRDLQVFPIGRQRLDAWFMPRGSAGSATPVRLHLWREGLLDDPTLYERASRSHSRGPRREFSEFDSQAERSAEVVALGHDAIRVGARRLDAIPGEGKLEVEDVRELQ